MNEKDTDIGSCLTSVRDSLAELGQRFKGSSSNVSACWSAEKVAEVLGAARGRARDAMSLSGDAIQTDTQDAAGFELSSMPRARDDGSRSFYYASARAEKSFSYDRGCRFRAYQFEAYTVKVEANGQTVLVSDNEVSASVFGAIREALE